MAKVKGGKVEVDFDNLLGSFEKSIDLVDPAQNYDAEAARYEDCISCGSRLIEGL